MVLSVLLWSLILGGVAFYTLPLSPGIGALVWAGSLALGWRFPVKVEREKGEPGAKWLIPLVLVAGGAWIASLTLFPITLGVRSPWVLVPLWTLLPLSAATCLSLFGRLPRLLALSIGLGGLLAAIVYPLGFGYDPFVHSATIEHLLRYESITPKEPYYAGLYGAVVSALHFFPSVTPLELLRFLVPVLFLGTLWKMISQQASVNRLSIALACAFFPLATIIQSTPYNLGILLVLLATFPGEQTLPRRYDALLFTASLLLHPIIAVAVGAMVLARSSWALGGLAAALGVPTLFFLQSLMGQGNLRFSLGAVFPLIDPHFSPAYSYQGDLLGLLANAWPVLALALITLSAIAFRARIMKSTLVLPFGFMIGSVLVAALYVPNLPKNESLDFAFRLRDIALIAGLPLIATALHDLLNHLRSTQSRLPLALLTALATMVAVFSAYPRHDAYARSGLFNVSEADYAIVAALDARMEKQPYAVVANQMTGAAALERFGFVGRYVNNGTSYFYPIPTSSPFGVDSNLLLTGKSPDIKATLARLQEDTGNIPLFIVVPDAWTSAKSVNAQLRAEHLPEININDAATVYELSLQP